MSRNEGLPGYFDADSSLFPRLPKSSSALRTIETRGTNARPISSKAAVHAPAPSHVDGGCFLDIFERALYPVESPGQQTSPRSSSPRIEANRGESRRIDAGRGESLLCRLDDVPTAFAIVDRAWMELEMAAFARYRRLHSDKVSIP